MLTTKVVRDLKVCRPNKPGKEYTKDGVPRHRHKIGKVFKTVFAPDGQSVVGFIVSRPDLLWMFKRPDRFLALDSMDIVDGDIVPTRGGDSWDEAAIKRLGLDWDSCIIWEGMEVKTPSGTTLGMVSEISFDETTGALNSLFLDDGGASRMLLGSVEIPGELMRGYKKGVLVVEPEAAGLGPSGGLAAKAGEATARIGIEAKEGAQKAGQAASKAVDAGAHGLGKLAGRAKRSVTGAVSNFREESGANERAAAKKAAEAKAKAAGASASATGKKGAAAAKSGTSAKSAKKKGSSVAGAVGGRVKAAGSMFSDFKKEFDRAKGGK